MPLKYWDEAFIAATYIINQLPTKVIGLSTPLEKLFKEKPNYTGCACWPNLHLFNDHKLQFYSKQCVFLGYSNMHKGFKCLNFASGRVYISRDVIFDETVYPFSKLNPNARARLRSDIPPSPPPPHKPNHIIFLTMELNYQMILHLMCMLFLFLLMLFVLLSPLEKV
jgi:hypothetical protein